MIDNDKWYESLGATVKQIALTQLTPTEIGKVIERIYIQTEREAERDSRESFNRQQGVNK